MKKLLLLVFIFLSFSLQAQEYFSNRQKIIDLDTMGYPENHELRVISISGNKYRIELPDNSVLSGSLTFDDKYKVDGKKVKRYKLDNGGLIAIGDESITVAITQTHNKAITYFLTDNKNLVTKNFKEASIEEMGDVYVSNKQSFEGKNFSQIKKIYISGDKFKAELPNGKILEGTLTPNTINYKDGKKRETFYTNAGNYFVLQDDFISIQLGETLGSIVSYYLTNYVDPYAKKLEEAKRRAESEEQLRSIIINIHKDNYDEFTQKCLDDRVVRIGMDGRAVSLLMDKQIRVQTTTTANGVAETQVYENYIVHVTNGKVDAISEIK